MHVKDGFWVMGPCQIAVVSRCSIGLDDDGQEDGLEADAPVEVRDGDREPCPRCGDWCISATEGKAPTPATCPGYSER